MLTVHFVTQILVYPMGVRMTVHVSGKRHKEAAKAAFLLHLSFDLGLKRLLLKLKQSGLSLLLNTTFFIQRPCH